MNDVFEKYLKHKKRISVLENTDTPEKLVKFCVQILNEEGYETKVKEEPKYLAESTRNVIKFSQAINNYHNDQPYIQKSIEYAKREICHKIVEQLVSRKKIVFTVGQNVVRAETIITGKLEI